MASSSSRVHVQNHIALQAARDGDLRTLKEMAERTDLRGAKDVEGASALHLAADKGCLECCKFLIEEVGLGVTSATPTGKTPLNCALYAGNAQIMKYLIDHGANPKKATAQGLTMLHIAAGRGLCVPLELLLSQGIPVDIMLSVFAGTPLHAAASMGQHQALKILLEHGADPNVIMDDNVTPLMLACCEKSLKCMRLLIEAGADADGNSYRGPTPLTYAVKAGWTDIVKFLLEAGADPNIPAEGGEIPIKLAAKGGRRDLVEILFSNTNYVPSLPYWTVDGIIRTMESPLISCQDPVHVEGKITALKSRGRAAFAKEDYHAALYFFGQVNSDTSDAQQKL
ncbi:ankyrin-1-like [Triticum urartu]|uniref:ankyrin-1-like n=1 Tax=Triticum urartu TaxID=4572 RepID=UPI0020435A3F|nr:ankyrin-1-like [Triticum urartu]